MVYFCTYSVPIEIKRSFNFLKDLILIVDNSIEISNLSFTPRDFELTIYLIKKLVRIYQ